MKSLKIVAPYKIEIKESEEKNDVLTPGKLKIRVNRVSLCGSDIKLYEGKYSGPCRYPLIFGHEWSGEVIGVAEGEDKFELGDHVTGDCSMWCGSCSNCKTDKNLCSNIEKFGITIDGYSRDVVIADSKYIYRAPNKLSFKALALTECFAVSLHALRCAGIEKLDKNSKILVIGGGAIGIAAYMFLRYHFHFANVSITEKNEKRLHTIQYIFPDIQVEAQNGGESKNEYQSIYANEGFPYIFDATGSTKGLDSAIQLASAAGKISYVGMDGSELANSKLITMKRLTVSGSIGGTGEFPEVISFFENNEEMVSKVVTCVVDCEDAEKAFKEMSNNPSNIKCQIKL